jgi:hypothetical protein
MRIPKPHAEREQVADGNRSVRGHRVVERPVEPLQHLAGGQLGKPPIHRIAEPQLAFLDQDHSRRGRDRLGQRRDAKDRVAPDRVAAADHLHADRIDVHFAPPTYQHDDTAHLSALDIARHDVAHAVEPRLGQCSGAHQVSIPCVRSDRLVCYVLSGMSPLRRFSRR